MEVIRLIGVVGLLGAGKDTVANYLKSKYGFAHIDLGHEIREELKRLGRDPKSRDEMVSLGNEMRERFGSDYWCRKAIESSEGNLVITSLRNPSEVELVESRMGIIMEVHANQKTRFGRVSKRVADDPTKHGETDLDEFITKEERELRSDNPSNQQLLKCIEMADYRLDNNGTIEELHSEIDALLQKLKG